MKIRRTQVVLIAFAVAAWLGAILELRAAAGSPAAPLDSDAPAVVSTTR